MMEPYTETPTKTSYWTIVTHSIIGYLGHSLMGVVDLLFCRDLGSKATATAGTGTSLFAWFMVIGIGLASALEFFIPHAVGEKNEEKAKSYLASGALICMVLAAVATFCMYFLCNYTEALGIHPDIAVQAGQFGKILSWSYISIYFTPFLRVELQTRGHSHDTTYAFIFSNLLNVILNWSLIYGHLGLPALGVPGAAYASVFSRLGILIFLIVRVFQARKPLHQSLWVHSVPLKESAKAILQMGMPISLHMLFEMGAFCFVGFLAARFEASQNAAHTIALTIVSFTFMVPLGICSAAAQTMSRALGEKNPNEALALGQKSIRIGLYFAAATSILYLVIRTFLMTLFTPDTETIRIGNQLLMVVAVFQLGDALQVILAGCLRGLGLSKIQAKVNAAGHWLVGIPVGLFLGFYLKWQILGLWVGLCVGLWTVAGGLFFWWKRSSSKLLEGRI